MKNKIIKKIEDCLSLPLWNAATCKAFFTHLRELLEYDGLKKSYPYVNLYGTWVVHPKIDRSPEGFEMLKKLTQSICIHNSDPRSVEDGDIHKRIIDTCGIITLRSELRDLLDSIGLSTLIVTDYELWKGVLSLLLQDLDGKPIRAPSMSKKKLEEIRSIAQACGQPEWEVTGFWFFADAGSAMWEISSKASEKKGVRLIGPVSLPPKNALQVK